MTDRRVVPKTDLHHQPAANYFATKDGNNNDLVFMSGTVTIPDEGGRGIAGQTQDDGITEGLVIFIPTNTAKDGPVWEGTDKDVNVVPSAALADIAVDPVQGPRWSTFGTFYSGLKGGMIELTVAFGINDFNAYIYRLSYYLTAMGKL